MDGPKTNEGAGAGVYGYGTRGRLSFSFGQYTTVFQQKCIPLRHVQSLSFKGTSVQTGTDEQPNLWVMLQQRGNSLTCSLCDSEALAELRCRLLGLHLMKPSDCHKAPLCTVLHFIGVSVLATGPKVRGFKPGRGRWILRMIKSVARLPSEGK
jgi:hypothetical protein